MRQHLLIAAAMCAGLSSIPAFAQTTRPATATETPIVSTTAGLDGIKLRSLQSVLDARERRQDWHDAAQQAESPIRDDALKQQLIQRLSGLAPRIAKELATHPQDDALVSVAVYKEPGPDGKQAMIAVTFDGLGSQVGGSYFADMLAGQVKPPQVEGVPANLLPDQEASSYLVMFLGNRGLQAGDIPAVKMRQSLVVAINRQREQAAHQDQVAIERQNLQANQQAQAAQEQQAQVAAAQQQSNQQQQQQVIPEYPYGVGGAAPNGYPDDGYYYPALGVPIVITPNGYANTPQWRDAQRAREQQLEKTYRSRNEVNRTASGNGQPVQPPPEGTVVPPGSQGTATPPGSQGTVTPPGSQGTVIPPRSQGTRQPAASSGQRSTQSQAPAAEHSAPASSGGAAHSEGSAPAGSGGSGGGSNAGASGGGAPKK